MGLEDSKKIGKKGLREPPAQLRHCLENYASSFNASESFTTTCLSPLALPPAAENLAG